MSKANRKGGLAAEFARRIRAKVLVRQVGMVKSLEGKIVRRNGIEYSVIKVEKGVVTASDLKTPIDQTTKFTVKAFMSKAIEVIDEGKE